MTYFLSTRSSRVLTLFPLGFDPPVQFLFPFGFDPRDQFPFPLGFDPRDQFLFPLGFDPRDQFLFTLGFEPRDQFMFPLGFDPQDQFLFPLVSNLEINFEAIFFSGGDTGVRHNERRENFVHITMCKPSSTSAHHLQHPRLLRASLSLRLMHSCKSLSLSQIHPWPRPTLKSRHSLSAIRSSRRG